LRVNLSTIDWVEFEQLIRQLLQGDDMC